MTAAYQPRTSIDPVNTSGPDLANIVEEVGFVAQARVLSRTSGEPASPSEGDAYIHDGSSSWSAGAEDDLLLFIDSVWRSVTPEQGWIAYVVDDDETVGYDGSTWSNYHVRDWLGIEHVVTPFDTADTSTGDYEASMDKDVLAGETVVVDFTTPSTNSAPQLENLDGAPGALTITTRAGSTLWSDALDGPHRLKRADDGNSWLVLDPKPSGGDQPASSTEVAALAKGIGEVFAVQTDIAGSEKPDNSGSAKFIQLTAGLTGAGQYNEGLLSGESVSGSSPTITATATIDDSSSPMNGETVRLINTEERFLRAGNAGVTQGSQFKSHNHGGSTGNSSVTTRQHSQVGGTGVSADRGRTAVGDADGQGDLTSTLDTSSHAHGITSEGGNETRARNVGITYYMRIA